MQIRRFARWVGSLALILGATACVVRDTPPVNPGYGYYGTQGYGPSYGPPPGGYGQSYGQSSDEAPASSGGVGEPTPYSVDSMPPEPLYEQMTPSPGDGFVWIDGYWHWNGYEWVWVNGRWERDQAGYVYIEPNYDYVGEQFVYTPGYWAPPARIPRGWHVRDHRNGRPTMVAPPVGSRPPVFGSGHHPPAIGSPGPRPVYPLPSQPGGSAIGRSPGLRPRPPGVPVFQGPPVTTGGSPVTGTAPPPAGTAAPGASGAAGGTIYYPPPRPPSARPRPPVAAPPTTWHPPVQQAPVQQGPIWVNPRPAPPVAAPVAPPVRPPVYSPGAPVPPSAWRPGPPVVAPHPAPSPPPATPPVHVPAPPPPAPPPAAPPANGNNGHPVRPR